MDIIQWSDEYSVNNFLLDAQHKKLISIINRLHTSMEEGKSKAVLEMTLDDLITYTRDHFNTEERMMMNANYPGLKEHKLLHEKLTQKVVGFQKKFREGESSISTDLMTFLRDWLVNHIEGTDKKYKNKLA